MICAPYFQNFDLSLSPLYMHDAWQDNDRSEVKFLKLF